MERRLTSRFSPLNRNWRTKFWNRDNLEIHVQAKTGNNYRAARLIVSGIVDVLQVHRSKKPAPHMDSVIRFDYFLRTVRERSIAEKKSQAAQSEITRVIVG